MFYKVLWQDLSTSWFPSKDVSEVAIDVYWIARHERAKARKGKRRGTMRQ